MAFEEQTFEAILKRLLDRVPSDVDKREGSIIYDALAPAAAEMAQMYMELDIALRLGFALTSSGEWLTMKAAEFGVDRKPATKARRKGLFYDSNNSPVDIPIGSRFSIDGLNYTAVERLAVGEFVMECEMPGTAGNQAFGSMLPIDYITGLSRAELADVLVPGEDEETDDALRSRLLLRIRQPGTSGNVSHYLQWALEVSGVGGAKVVPLWSGPGTVKVIIVDNEKKPATSELVSAVASHIEEVRPIGASVTVVSAIGKAIDVSGTVVLASGYALQNVQEAFKLLLSEYLRETAFSTTYVSYAKIGNLLLSTPGVIDYSGLTLNGGTVNVALQDDEVPVLGTVSLEV